MRYSVFFGCYHDVRHGFAGSKDSNKPINVSSIRLIDSAINYQQVIQAITAFDNIISHNYEADISHGWKAGELLQVVLQDNYRDKVDAFIYQSVRLSLNKKTEIEINIYELDQLNSIPTKSCLFIGSVIKRRRKKKENYVLTFNEPYTNMFRFDYFRNLKYLSIKWSTARKYLLVILIIFSVRFIN